MQYSTLQCSIFKRRDENFFRMKRQPHISKQYKNAKININKHILKCNNYLMFFLMHGHGCSASVRYIYGVVGYWVYKKNIFYYFLCNFSALYNWMLILIIRHVKLLWRDLYIPHLFSKYVGSKDEGISMIYSISYGALVFMKY